MPTKASSLPRPAATLVVAMLAAAWAGCRSPQPPPLAAIPVDTEATFSYWNGDGIPGPASITIDLSEQAAYFYKGGQLVGRSRVATGRSSHPTPTGSFMILEKKVEKRSNVYGLIYDAGGEVVNWDADARTDPTPEGGRFQGASMPFWMRLTNTGVGMHAGPIPNPGRPASHGCIRMPRTMAVTFHHNVEIGTPVTIVP
jgi:lipoprotein-anchoring transpeptidase ErfK/SrfK